jgi:hypothetical protein
MAQGAEYENCKHPTIGVAGEKTFPPTESVWYAAGRSIREHSWIVNF